MSVSNVFIICEAYESGVGKGAANSKFKEGIFVKGTDEQEAYTLGYEFGLKKYNDKKDSES